MLRPNLENIAYGPHKRNILDVYLPEGGNKPMPALIFFHGGGYISGDKSAIHKELLEPCLEAGIAVISCNYRLITNDPFPAPMNDGTRAIQFVRSKSDELGIDSARIATSGSSAGGHIALWNALYGDRSQPNSEDPIERIRTDVCAFVGFGTQASKDQRFYDDIYEGPHIQPNLALYYGVTSIEELYTPENLRLMERASAITYMSEQAPPAFLVYDYDLDLQFPHIPKSADVSEVIHHPLHGYRLQQRYEAYGIRCELRPRNNPVRAGEIIAFLNDYIGPTS